MAKTDKKKDTATLTGHNFGKYPEEIVSVTNILSDGYHNAFVDLCIWKDDYYLAYRRADWHDPIPPGNIVIMRSSDAHHWDEVAVIDTGGDDRDPKFLLHELTPDLLHLYWGAYYKRWDGKTLSNNTRDLITCGSQTRNGTVWCTPYQIYRPNYWMWTTARGYNGYTYGMAYHFGQDLVNSLTLLFKGKRFANWETICQAMPPTHDYTDLSEPALFAVDSRDEEFHCITRTSESTLIGFAKYPYDKWKWHEAPEICHCPVVCKAHGKIYVAGRTRLDFIPGLTGEDAERAMAIVKHKKFEFDYKVSDKDDDDDALGDDALIPKGKPKNWLDDVYRCVLFEYHPKTKSLEYRLTVPSARDCSYPGMVYDMEADELILAYYSQHELPKDQSGLPRPADIYIARIGFPDAPG